MRTGLIAADLSGCRCSTCTGLSTGDFRQALPVLLGEDAAGLSPSAVTRLLGAWQEEYRRWRTRPLADRDYVYPLTSDVSLRALISLRTRRALRTGWSLGS